MRGADEAGAAEAAVRVPATACDPRMSRRGSEREADLSSLHRGGISSAAAKPQAAGARSAGLGAAANRDD